LESSFGPVASDASEDAFEVSEELLELELLELELLESLLEVELLDDELDEDSESESDSSAGAASFGKGPIKGSVDGATEDERS
jgi:hypothetical protein